MTKWSKVYSTDKPYRADMVKSLLDQNDLHSVIINKRDSSYHFGLLEVHVASDEVMRALQLINNDIDFK